MTLDELKSLKSAKIKIVSGQQVAKVSYNGRTVEYGAANLTELNRLISQGEAELGVTTKRYRTFRVSTSKGL